MRTFLKYGLWLLAGVITAGWTILELLGLVNVKEDANKVWRLMVENGLVGIVVVSVSVFLAYLGWRLFLQEVELRRSTSISTKIAALHRSSIFKKFFDPIQWHDYEHFLAHIGTSLQATRDLQALAAHPDFHDRSVVRIERFQLLGYAKTCPLKPSSGYIQSLITGETIPVLLNGHEPRDVEVPAHESFRITAAFSCPDHLQTEDFKFGLPITEFRKRWREFRFVFELEGGKRLEEVFAGEEVDLFLYRCVTGLQWANGNTRQSIFPMKGKT